MKDKELRKYLGVEERWYMGCNLGLRGNNDSVLEIHKQCLDAIADYLGVEFVPKNSEPTQTIVRKKKKLSTGAPQNE